VDATTFRNIRGSKKVKIYLIVLLFLRIILNPFYPSTVISYSLPKASNIKLIVYNTLGQSIQTLESGYKPAGNYSVNFNASALPSGIYFYKLEAGQYSQIKKMMLIK
jgi:hypothetical protein